MMAGHLFGYRCFAVTKDDVVLGCADGNRRKAGIVRACGHRNDVDPGGAAGVGRKVQRAVGAKDESLIEAAVDERQISVHRRNGDVRLEADYIGAVGTQRGIAANEIHIIGTALGVRGEEQLAATCAGRIRFEVGGLIAADGKGTDFLNRGSVTSTDHPEFAGVEGDRYPWLQTTRGGI